MEQEEVSSEETDLTSEVEESGSQSESSEGVEQEATTQETSQEQENIPLNDPRNPYYDRFSELNHQNKEFKGRLGEYDGVIRGLQQQLSDLRAQSEASKPKPEAPYKPLIDHLRTLNPDFAKFQEDLIQRAERAEQKANLAEKVQSELQEMRQQEFASKVENRFQSLLSENKVASELKEAYEALAVQKVNQLRGQGKRLGVQDVDGIFNDVHTAYQKLFDNIRRTERAQYVQEKKQDKTPAQVTGGAAVAPRGSKIAAGDEQALIKYLADGMRRDKQGI